MGDRPLRETNSRLLAQLDELQCQLQPLRLQVEALTKTRDRQVAWATEAQRCLIELARLLREFTDDGKVCAAVQASRSIALEDG
jgi:hypothetical protein